MTPDWRIRAERLAETLADDGASTDPRWAEALRTVPRHVFVPEFFEQTTDGSGWERVDPTTDPERWADAVHADRSLVTELRSSPTVLDGHPIPSSSSTPPSLMVRMLELLDVTEGDRVLEIGTGTGWNAALLSSVVGAARVTTVELQPDLASIARERLAAIGLHPTVVTGDGGDGAPDGAPYDRIIATCGVSRVPGAWVSQLAAGGRIVADLRSESSSSLVALDALDHDHVAGHLVGRPGLFMWMRPTVDHPLLDPARATPDTRAGERTGPRESVVDPRDLDAPGLRTLIGIACPELEVPPVPGQPISDGAGSWARLDGSAVTQGGPRRPWDRIEAVARIWRQLGTPGTERFGVTVDSAGTHRFWLDRPTDELPAEVGDI
ncbi:MULTISPECIES: methyltransferase domain-containing protein [unclassified Pseudonocardia]|uniref:methyltransferase domain-containing protein n=1 Tax=unclassified Pseudonocardia TaxID=2619320 RepID=UPI0001FFE21C|nr:methyltransferase domain-containing protein [Pseudonocardia sp. Ae707_Ps1]OLM16332.1 Protein-L-isoaspartate O-methyltransferase [Pseudonocardia sp. Ae707_Ps1]